MDDLTVPPGGPREGSPFAFPYAFLNDEPLRGPEHPGTEDVLGTRSTAAGLADLISASRSSTPFTVAVDAGWGMGKSSLMQQAADVLARYPHTECVWFNAWTAHGADALEGLLKSVLLRFDRNVLRRALNRARENRTALRVVRTTVAVALGLLHAGRVVDELWSRMEADAATRNEARQLIKDMAADWSRAGSGPGRPRLLVVFVDDLDRCPDQTVHAVCEAVKVYLDVPGLVFVLGCDQSRLAEAGAAGGPTVNSDYLEKIVQISFRVPTPDAERAAALVQQYARRSGTERFLTPGLARLVAERTGRNPRRIKRLINGLVMYQLDPRWAGTEPEALIRAVLLQHLYPDFHRAAGRPDGSDLIGDFAQYYEARGMLRRRAVTPDDPRWNSLAGFADQWLLPPPDREDNGRWDAYLEQLEGQLPSVFPELAADPTFVRLITELNGLPYADRLRELIRQGPAAAPPGPRRIVPQPTQQQPGRLAPEAGEALPPWPGEPSRPGTGAVPAGSSGGAVPAGSSGRAGSASPTGVPAPGLPSPLPEVPFPGPYPPPLGQAAPSGAPVQPAAAGAYDYPRFLRDAGHAGRAPDASARRGTLPLHVLWVDDKPESVVHLVQELRQLGAEVDTALSTGEAATWLARHPAPDVLISDTKRAGDVVEGFRAVVQFRKAGYDGPLVFYSGQVSGHNHRLAEEVGAIGLTNSWSVLVELLDGIVRSRAVRTDP